MSAPRSAEAATPGQAMEHIMSRSNWTADAIPDQTGKLAIVTGASSGLGKETARVLASKGARVILAVRNVVKGEAVAESLRRGNPGAALAVRALDLASLTSVRAFAEAILAEESRLDLLVNNAGVMVPPYGKTEDGFELQFGTNHLGHFALVEHLLPLLKATEASRIVVLSSLAHRGGNLDFSDLDWQKRKYSAQRAYGDSKIANLYFAYELARRLKDDPDAPLVTAAHPGWTRTELQRHSGLFSFLNNFFAQDVGMGTLPTLRAAFDPQAQSGDYFGPARHFEMHGHPVKVRSNARSRDPEIARRLWETSEALTGVSY